MTTRRRTAPRLLTLCLVAPLVGLSALPPSVAATPATPASRVSTPPDAQVCPGALEPIPFPTTTATQIGIGSTQASADGTLWSVGNQVVDGVFRPYAVTGPVSGPLTSVAVPSTTIDALSDVRVLDAQHAWLLGHTTNENKPIRVLHWSGGAFRDVTPVALLPQVYTFGKISAAADDDVWVTVTDLATTSGHAVALHWDGHTWHRADFPDSWTTSTLVATTSGVWALVGRDETTGFLRWDGTSWQQAPAPADPSAFYRLIGGGDHLAVIFGDAAGERLGTWNGTAWVVAPVSPGVPSGIWFDMAPDGTVWKAGNLTPGTGIPQVSGLSSWDGSRWTTRGLVDGPVPDGVVGVSATEAVVPIFHDLPGSPSTQQYLARTCTTQVTSAGLLRPGTTVFPGVPALVQDRTGLTSGPVLVDRLGLFPRTPFGGARPASYRYPGAGTFQAQVRGVPGLTGASATVTTSVPPYVYGNGFPVTLVVGADALPSGWAYQVQAQAPGTAAFRTVVTGTTAFLSLRQSKPNPGVWHYRSRMVRTDGTAQSGWSPAVSITR